MTLGLGLKDAEMLCAVGEMDAVRLTLPEKPRLLSVIVDDAAELHTTGLIWLADRVKSALMVTEMLVGWEIVPLIAFRVTV